MGLGIGGYIPVGPDRRSLSSGVCFPGKLGYQFTNYFALELPYDLESGNFSVNGANVLTNLRLIPYLDVKPILPIDSRDDLYALFGAGYYNMGLSINNQSQKVLFDGIGYNIGIGYERYVLSGFFVFWGELQYNRIMSDKYPVVLNDQLKLPILPYTKDYSRISIITGISMHF